jgi:hypothetical protein
MSPVSIEGLSALRRLRERCQAEGYEFVARAGPEHASEISVALWDFGSLAIRPSWIGANARVIAWSLESPLVAHRAYHRLPEIASASEVVLGFPGVARLLEGRGEFRPLYWPVESGSVPDLVPWKKRRFGVMVNSNKSVDSLRGQISLREPYRSARRLAAATLASTYRVRGRWYVPNLYRTRLQVIDRFSSRPDFDLWGTGWKRPIAGASQRVRVAVASAFRGVSGDKVATLTRYRFAFCVENTRFPGYISEKLFDAFRAGVVPVYLGAPDVDSYVPEESFVAMDAFKDLSSLRRYLESMSEDEARERIAVGRDFLGSPSSRRFTEEHFVETIMSAIFPQTR